MEISRDVLCCRGTAGGVYFVDPCERCITCDTERYRTCSDTATKLYLEIYETSNLSIVSVNKCPQLAPIQATFYIPYHTVYRPRILLYDSKPDCLLSL
jgi:hypothetical protein